MSRSQILFSCIGLLPFVILAQPLQRDAGRVLPAAKPIHVVAFGDFGTGNSNQAAVARAIAQRNASLPFDLGITMGDNFYFCGMRSVSDPKWKSRWEDFYTPLGFPFYARSRQSRLRQSSHHLPVRKGLSRRGGRVYGTQQELANARPILHFQGRTGFVYRD